MQHAVVTYYFGESAEDPPARPSFLVTGRVPLPLVLFVCLASWRRIRLPPPAVPS